MKGEKTIKTPLNPWIYPLFFVLTAVLALAGGLPELTAAYISGIFFLIVAALHPLNGIYFLLLAVPFFLGDSKRPFYLLPELFVYATVLSGGIHWAIKRPRIRINNLILPVAAFAAVSVLAFPLELKEILWDLRLWHPMETLRAAGSAHEASHMYYFRTVSNYLSGAALFFLAMCFVREEKDIERIFKPLLLMLFINSLFAYLLRFDIIPRGGTYLTLSLVGRHGPGASAFAYNRGYLNQYLSVFFPFALYFIIKEGRGRLMPAASFFLLGGVFAAMALTFQRASAPVIAGQFLLLAVLAGVASEKPSKSLAAVLGFFVLLAGVFYSADRLILSGRGVDRLVSEGIGPRIYLWNVAAVMFAENPLLGIGNGRFLIEFRDYCELAGMPFERIQFFRSTAHSVYMHLLAEQGALGISAFLFIIAAYGGTLLRNLKGMPEEKKAIAGVLALSLAGWLLYGITQHTFYLRSIGISFWILLGFSAFILRDRARPADIPRKKKIAVLFIFLALLSFRGLQAARHPYPENYYAGFYRAETQPDGRTARWTGREAVRMFPSGGGDLVIGLKCPTPAVAGRPQEIQITANKLKKVAILYDTEYKELLFPAEKLGEDVIRLRIKPSYTVNPKRESWSQDERNLGVMVYEPVWKER